MAIDGGFISGSALMFLTRFGKTIAKPFANFIRSNFENKDILILGEVGSGKTSLINYLTTGSPLDAQGRRPNPTQGVVDNEKQKIQDDKIKRLSRLERIKKDVSGEAYNEWKKLINEVKPHGIIYLINGAESHEKINHSIHRFFSEILSEYFTQTLRLRAIHVFVSFSDVIVNQKGYDYSQEIKRHIENKILSELKSSNNYSKIRERLGVKLRVKLVNINPANTKWDDLNKSLTSFGDDLRTLN